jgi:hypothetical protein
VTVRASPATMPRAVAAAFNISFIMSPPVDWIGHVRTHDPDGRLFRPAE